LGSWKKVGKKFEDWLKKLKKFVERKFLKKNWRSFFLLGKKVKKLRSSPAAIPTIENESDCEKKNEKNLGFENKNKKKKVRNWKKKV